MESAEEHLANTGRKLEIQTEKLKTKIVPCTYAGCGVDLVVNVFYAPYKGKCQEHGGQKTSAIVSSHLTHVGNPESAKENGALGKLLCPICGNHLVIVRIEETSGWITFRCTDGSGLNSDQVRVEIEKGRQFCGTSIQIRPKWAAMEFRNYPTAMAELIKEFNVDQMVKHFDAIGL